jgi:GNAT superfamily N-acetyltransferase
VNALISVATPDDARAIAALRVAVAQEMTRRFGEGHWSALISKAAVHRQLRASRVLVAREKGRIVGTVRLAVAIPSVFDSSAFTPVETALYVLGLAVAPDSRQRGIGRALMDAAKEVAQTWPAQALWLDAYRHAAGAGPFYERCGFRELGPSASAEVPVVFYEWLAAQTRKLSRMRSSEVGCR